MSNRANGVNSPLCTGLVAVVLAIGLIGHSRAETGATGGSEEPFTPRTHVSLRDGRWLITGEVTYQDSRAEGLLMNVRVVNAVYEDRRKPDFDPDANTGRFLSHIADYAAHGVGAFTIGLQGGMPGYEGALNSAFNVEQTAAPTHEVQGLEMRFHFNARTFSHGWELPARWTGEGGRSGRGIPADARW